MCNVHFRMLADKVHFLIHCLYALHVRSCVVSQLYLLAAADALCAPIEVTHVYGTSYFAGNCVEASLPSSDRLACSFRSKRKVYYLTCLHFLDHAQNDIAASLSVYRYST